MNTVLIVEDEKMIRQGIKTIVQRSGVPINVIIECSNGLMALDILRNQKVDVMFTDIRMPKMNGIELVTAIQEMKNKPLIIAISGYDDFSYAVEMMRMGVREYILKPVDRDKVRDILEKLNIEIEQNNVNHDKSREVSYQQIKYLMLNKHISSQEVEVIVKQCEEYFYTEPYAVCCTPKKIAPDKHNNHYIHLGDIDYHEIIIVPEQNKNYLLKNELKNSFAGVSSLHRGMEELKIAYEESIIARKLAYIKGEAIMIHQEKGNGFLNADRAAKADQSKAIDSGKMIQIGQMIGTDKINDAIVLLERLEKETRWGRYTLENLEEYVGLLMDTIKETYQNILTLEEEELSRFRNLFGYPSMELYFQKLMEYIINMNEIINTQFDDYKNKHKIQQATEYIRENFDKDLNMAVVSNHISMNYSLFSYVFKQYTGYNFVNYLKNLRINEAKHLLSETDLYVNEISQQVGYNNEKHFMKIFKNTCGVSPTEYRKNMMLNK